MNTCDKNCKHMELFVGIKDHKSIETKGLCTKHNKLAYFGDECPDYEARDKEN